MGSLQHHDSSGDLGGTIQTRDQTIQLASYDALANQFRSAMNAAQAKGFDQSGNAGRTSSMFLLQFAGSAGDISMAPTNP